MTISENVLIVNDSSSGGAAGSTRRLLRVLSKHTAMIHQRYFSPPVLNELSIASSLDSRRKRPPLERIVKNISKNAAKAMMQARHEKALFSEIDRLRPSVINLRNIHDSGIDHETILKFDPKISIVWTMHDCWPYRPYAFEYHNSKTNQIEYALPYKNSALAREIRQNFFRVRNDIVMVAPSRWLANDAKRVLPDCRIEHIPNGISLDKFYPLDKSLAKNVLGLDSELIWLGFASTWANARKGLDILIDALVKLDSLEGVGFVAWGGPFDQSWPSHIPLVHYGRVENEDISRILYSAMDVFVCPSRADNLPNTCLEALACGTPILGSSAGGIPEMAVDGQTGWIFENDSCDDLALKLLQVIDERGRWHEFGQSSIHLARSNYDVNLTAQKYLDLFKSLTPVSAK